MWNKGGGWGVIFLVHMAISTVICLWALGAPPTLSLHTALNLPHQLSSSLHGIRCSGSGLSLDRGVWEKRSFLHPPLTPSPPLAERVSLQLEHD